MEPNEPGLALISTILRRATGGRKRVNGSPDGPTILMGRMDGWMDG